MIEIEVYLIYEQLVQVHDTNRFKNYAAKIQIFVCRYSSR